MKDVGAFSVTKFVISRIKSMSPLVEQSTPSAASAITNALLLEKDLGAVSVTNFVISRITVGVTVSRTVNS